jgi:hypothetical protein
MRVSILGECMDGGEQRQQQRCTSGVFLAAGTILGEGRRRGYLDGKGARH